jgi:hypothetical protein
MQRRTTSTWPALGREGRRFTDSGTWLFWVFMTAMTSACFRNEPAIAAGPPVFRVIEAA